MRERERERRARARSDIPARLTHLVPARVLPARRFKISSPGTPDHRERARARTYRHAQRCTRWGPYPWSISFLLTREKTTTFSHPHLTRCHITWSLLVAPVSDSSSSISSVFERFARGSWENEAGGSQISESRNERVRLFLLSFIRPVDLSVRPLGSNRAPFIRAGILMRARARARVCVCVCVCIYICVHARIATRRGACRPRRGRGRYIIFVR